METILADSDFLIDVSRNEEQAIAFLEELELRNEVAVSSVTAMELIVGCRDRRQLVRVRDFLRRFIILHLTEEISEKSFSLLEAFNLSHGLLISDAMIAATALSRDLHLFTGNTKDFRFIDGLKLQDFRQVRESD